MSLLNYCFTKKKKNTISSTFRATVYLVRLIKFCVQTSILFEQANVLSLINLLTNTYADMTLVSMVGGVLCVHAREPIELYNTDFITVV